MFFDDKTLKIFKIIVKIFNLFVLVKKEKEKNANTDPSFVSQFIIFAFPIDFPTFALYVVAKKKKKSALTVCYYHIYNV